MAAAVVDLWLVPPDRVQGDAQRLMYVHVPSIWTAYLCFGVAFLASWGVLARHDRRWDAVARAAAELGVAMTALTLLEGSLWGSSSWGTWWTWDPRLVSTALLLLVYGAYLLVRLLPGPESVVRRRAAVLAVVAPVQVVVVHFSVLWFRSIHQPPSLLGPDQPAPIAGSMLCALLLSTLAFSLAGVWVVRARCRQLWLQDDGADAPAPVVRERVAEPFAAAPR